MGTQHYMSLIEGVIGTEVGYADGKVALLVNRQGEDCAAEVFQDRERGGWRRHIRTARLMS